MPFIVLFVLLLAVRRQLLCSLRGIGVQGAICIDVRKCQCLWMLLRMRIVVFDKRNYSINTESLYNQT